MKKLLILGGASCVWSDIEQANSFGEYDSIMAVNDVGCDYPGFLNYWVTLHHEKFKAWQEKRASNGGNRDYVAIAHIGSTRRIVGEPRLDMVLDYRIGAMNASGSSGLFAVRAGIHLGFERIVLAGIPMTIEGRHYFNDSLWHERDQFTEAWHIAKNHISLYVRSISGWTKELLGAPTADWLNGRDAHN